MKNILLVRHGQASVLSDNYDQLSELGHLQSRLLGEAWARSGQVIDHLIVGPLVRHRETMEELLQGFQAAGGSAPPVAKAEAWTEHQGLEIVAALVPKLAEDDAELAQWQGSLTSLEGDQRVKRYFEMYRKVSRLWARGELDLGGTGLEDWEAFKSRVLGALAEVVEQTPLESTTVVVTSAGAIGMALGGLLGLSDERILEMSWVVRNSSVHQVREIRSRLAMLSFNDLGHLEDASQVTFV